MKRSKLLLTLVLAAFTFSLEAVNLIKEHNPDLVFLDVQMPGLDGFGVIKKLVLGRTPEDVVVLLFVPVGVFQSRLGLAHAAHAVEGVHHRATA